MTKSSLNEINNVHVSLLSIEKSNNFETTENIHKFNRKLNANKI